MGLAPQMTGAYYVEALMREEVTPDERRILRALAIRGLRSLIEERGTPLESVPDEDGNDFTL